MPFLPLDLLRAGASELGIELSDDQLALFDAFAAFLVETNRKFNLTRITEPEEIVNLHLLDSLVCLWAREIAPGARVIDVGAGAGFPGMPIKIVRSDISLTLVDSTLKKVGFMRQAAEMLGLRNVEVVHARAEEIGHDKSHREHHDVAYARALADLPVLAELCLPLVRVGGRVVATKGPDVDDEIEAARSVIGQLAGVIEKVVRTRIPGTDVGRTIPVMLKTKPTPERFPRSFVQIARGSKRR